MPWKRLPGSAQHPAVSSLTLSPTVTSISSAQFGQSQQNFPPGAHTALCRRNILWGPAVFCWALRLCWDSGLLSRLKHPASDGHEDGRPSKGRALRRQWYYAAFFFFSFGWRLMVAVHGSESRPPLICQSQPKSIHLQHSTATLGGEEVSGGGSQRCNQSSRGIFGLLPGVCVI